MLDTDLKSLTDTSSSSVRALPAESENRQRRRMVLALVLLLGALGLVLVKDRDFWFPSQDAADSDATDDVATASAGAPPSAALSLPRAPVMPAKPHRRETALAAAVAPSGPPVVASRPVLPPLEIEVVAGEERRPVRPGNAAVKVNLQSGASNHLASSPSAAPTEMASIAPGPLTGATERVRISSAPALTHQVQPEYPLLARQMKVQGSVVLEAMVGKDGGIQELRVLTGPSILAGAAREAVKQWRFKPYVRDGQPVDTQTNITVNFTIQTQ
jgi:periplasmic protein TonB